MYAYLGYPLLLACARAFAARAYAPGAEATQVSVIVAGHNEADEGSSGECLYWRCGQEVKKLESAMGILLGTSGASFKLFCCALTNSPLSRAPTDRAG